MVSPHLTREFIKQYRHSTYSDLPSSFGLNFSSIVFPLILDILIYNYGFNGPFIIFSAIILNYIPLSLIATYNIPFRWPNFKWRVRKRSSNYSPPTLEQKIGTHNFAASESFASVFEPDIIRKESQSSVCVPVCAANLKSSYSVINQTKNTSTNEDGIMNNEASDVSKDLEIQPPSRKLNPCLGSIPQLANKIKNYEKRRQAFEGSFTHQDIVPDIEPAEITAESFKRCELNYPCEVVVSNIKQDIVLCPVDRESCVLPSENVTKTCLKEGPHTPKLAKTDNSNKLNNSKVSSAQLIPKQPLLDIKVHVVECIFTSRAQYLYETSNAKATVPKRNGYRKHSNSLPSGCYNNIDFTTLNFINSNTKLSCNHQLNTISGISSILEEEDDTFKNLVRQNKNTEQNNDKTSVLISKAKQIFKTLTVLTEPCYVFVILTLVIYEFILVTLLMIFADVGKETEGQNFGLKWILVAFGIGGIFGRLCFGHMIKRMVDRTYVIAAVIFTLNGLATAGVLWSTDRILLTLFYAIIGSLESGVMQTIPKLILLSIGEDAEPLILSSSSCLSAIAVLVVPYAIGISRDETGDYELLLEIISCCSILCAMLCFFLPRLPTSKNTYNGD